MQSLGFLVATAAGGSLGIRLLAACPMAMHTNEVISPPPLIPQIPGKKCLLLWDHRVARTRTHEQIMSHEHEHTSKSTGVMNFGLPLGPAG